MAFTAPASDVGDVVAALRALGYSLSEANAAAVRVGNPAGSTVEERVVAALRAMGE
jgi:hypothetical protein